jgi:hypothetical protein
VGKKEKREKDYFKDAFVDALLLLLLFSKTMCISESKTRMGSKMQGSKIQKWDQRYQRDLIPKGSRVRVVFVACVPRQKIFQVRSTSVKW